MVPLSDAIRERVVFLGGKVSEVSCPDCAYSGREADLDAHRYTDIECPECGSTILTEKQKAELRRAGKL